MSGTHVWRVLGNETRIEDILEYEEEGFEVRKFPNGEIGLMQR